MQKVLSGAALTYVAAAAQALGEQPSMKQMGLIIKAVNAKAAGRAEGAKVAAKVKAALA